MKIILATGNKNKAKEIRKILSKYFKLEVFNYTDFIDEYEIIEDASSFKGNAIIKSKSIFDKLKPKYDEIILSDDSGISISALDNKPNIYSARFYQDGLSKTEIALLENEDKDKLNRKKLIISLKDKNQESSPAFFTSAICIKSIFGLYTSHGYLYGKVFTNEQGNNGFGYDSMFQPKGYKKRLAQISQIEKNKISHRKDAIYNLIPVFRILEKKISNYENY